MICSPGKIARGLRLLSLIRLCLLAILLSSASAAGAQGTWTNLRDTAPNLNAGVMLLLTDGSVIVKSIDDLTGYSNIWNKLTPDSNGSYLNGTWSHIAPMADERFYFSSHVLKSGKVYVAGGEYGSGCNKAELYDPVADAWTPIPGIASIDTVADANSKFLPDGRIMQNIVNSGQIDYGTKNLIYDPVSNTYSPGPKCRGNADESSWLMLPDQSLLFVDIHSYNAERYIPGSNKWIADAHASVLLYDNYIYEDGPALLLPDGRAFFIGANGTSAYYYPSGDSTPGSWDTGPMMPGGNGIPDGAAAMMPDGHILCAVSPVPNDANPDSFFHSPTYFYEFDYLADSFIQVTAPYGSPYTSPAPGLPYINVATYTTDMLDLPDGNILFSTLYDKQYYLYTPGGAPIAAGQPAISTISRNGCEFMITGELFNGISEGASYGDDWQMATNYPIVKLTTNTGRVYYASTHDWNSTGVQRGWLADTAYFTVPRAVPNGTYSLTLIANSISSLPKSFSYVSCVTGVAEARVTPLSLQVSPNPASTWTAFSFSADQAGAFTIRLTDLTGRVVSDMDGQASAGTNLYHMRLSEIPRGMYIAVLEKNNRSAMAKVVVE